MSLLNDVPEGVLVGLDTPPIIYYIEEHPTYGPIVKPFFELRLPPALNLALTSTVSLAEALILPLRNRRLDLVTSYRDFLVSSRDVALVPVSTPVADACQMAAALDEGATHFLTNDAKLRRVTELTVLILDDYLPPPATPTATAVVP